MQRLIYKTVNLHLRLGLLVHSSRSTCLHKLPIALVVQWCIGECCV